MNSSLINVLIADDSLAMRDHLTAIVRAEPQMQVVGTATNGYEALMLVEKRRPDVVSMDVVMPEMDGLVATRQIMHRFPTPVVIVSKLDEPEVDISIRALQAGALAVVPKPPAHTHPAFEHHRHRLVSTLRAMAGVSVIRRWLSAEERANAPSRQYYGIRPGPAVIGIGASAGGPGALSVFLHGLGHVSVPVVVVQHMPAEFLDGLSRWLSNITTMPVRIANDGDVIYPGMVHLAPGTAHLRVVQEGDYLIARLDSTAAHGRYLPSVDVLFGSLAETCGERGVGVILTGMGDDGAAGLLAMRHAGARTFAQDRESAVVYGMPGAAVARGAVESVFSPLELAAVLRKLL